MKFNMVFNIIQSIGQCPLGPAWADKAYATDQAHQNVECSNAGTCDRKGGTCSCFPGFTGAACQRSKTDIFIIILIDLTPKLESQHIKTFITIIINNNMKIIIINY